MAQTIKQLAVGALDECQQPDPSAPRIDFVMRKVVDAANLIRQRAQNVGFNWDARSIDIAVSEADGDGKFILSQAEPDERITLIQTTDPANPYHIPRDVQITDPANVSQFYRGAKVGSQVAVFSHWRGREDGALMLQAHPAALAGDTAQCFTVWLERGSVPLVPNNIALASLGGFEAYLRIQAALAILPACEWSRLLGEEAQKVDPVSKLKVYEMYRSGLAESLAGQLAAWEQVFRNFVNSGWEQQSPPTRAYGDWLGGSWA